jgi:ribosomal protein L11 methyltransferase
MPYNDFDRRIIMNKTWAQVSYVLPSEMVDDFSEFLMQYSPDGVVTENLTLDTFSLDAVEEPPFCTVSAFLEADESLTEKISQIGMYLARKSGEYPGYLPGEPAISYIKEEDWSSNWKVHFKPMRIGSRFVVKPTWEDYPRSRSDIIIELDPGMAFGTGSHATTKLCMEVLEKIFFREGAYSNAVTGESASILDVGTGSGILAVAAVKLGAGHVVAIDIDPQALIVAKENILLNGCGGSVTVTDTPLPMVDGDYDIVVANILAEELARMSGALTEKVRPGGFLILSGILAEKEEIVIEGFSRPELGLVETTRDAEWSCLTYRREL